MGGKSPDVPSTDDMPSKKKCDTCGKPIADHTIDEVIECASE